MFLYRIHLNPRNRNARRDLADPYQMHSSLCRAFFKPTIKCPPRALLWRLEPEVDMQGQARILIQSRHKPDWSQPCYKNWLANADPGIDLVHKLDLDALETGKVFRFRLRANPCKKIQGKRRALLQPSDQQEWLARKGKQHGFILQEPGTVDYFEHLQSIQGYEYENVRVSHQQMLLGRKHDGNEILTNSVLFEGKLIVTDPKKYRLAVLEGIGPAKAFGCGLLSLAAA